MAGDRGAPDDGLRALLHTHLPRLHWSAIESGSTIGGIPDSEYCADGQQGWIECKATSANMIVFRPLQVGWLSRRIRQGGRAWVATRRRHAGGPRLGAAVDELWLHDARWVAELAAHGLIGADPVLVTRSGPSRWDWGLIEAHLLGRA